MTELENGEKIGIVEAVAKAICKASSEEWRIGTYELRTGKNFEWETHNADVHNNHWRFKAVAAIKAMSEYADVPEVEYFQRLK